MNIFWPCEVIVTACSYVIFQKEHLFDVSSLKKFDYPSFYEDTYFIALDQFLTITGKRYCLLSQFKCEISNDALLRVNDVCSVCYGAFISSGK